MFEGQAVLVADQEVQQLGAAGRACTSALPTMFLPWSNLDGSMETSLPAHDVADFDEGAAIAEHVDAFGQQVGPAHQLHHHIGAAAVGQLA